MIKDIEKKAIDILKELKKNLIDDTGALIFLIICLLLISIGFIFHDTNLEVLLYIGLLLSIFLFGQYIFLIVMGPLYLFLAIPFFLMKFFNERIKVEDDKEEKISQAINVIGKSDSIKMDSFVIGINKWKFHDYIIDGIQPVNTDTKADSKFYEVYKGRSKELALNFLQSIPYDNIPSLHYIIVETPQGNFGKDMEIIFNEATGQKINMSLETGHETDIGAKE